MDCLQPETAMFEHTSVKDTGDDDDSDEGADIDDDDDGGGTAAVEHKTHVRTIWVQMDFSRLPLRLRPLLGLPAGQPFATTMGVGLSQRFFVWQPLAEWYEMQHHAHTRPLPDDESHRVVMKAKAKLAAIEQAYEEKGGNLSMKESHTKQMCEELLQ